MSYSSKYALSFILVVSFVIDGVLRKWFLELSTLNAFVVKVFFIT